MQQSQGTTNQSIKELEITYYISHYLNLFWRWIWYILITLPITISGFFFYLIFFDAIKPQLEATVMIGLESGEGKSAVGEIGEYTPQSRLALIKAKGFLWHIVNKTSLRLQVKGYDLHQIFDSVYVDSLAPSGNYKLKISDNIYELYFSSKELNIKNKLIESGSLIKLNQISTSGIYCKLSSDFLKNPHNVSFSIIRPHKAIEWLYKNITIYDKELTKDRYANKKDSFVGISLKGRDYKRITKIINVIADEFVSRSLGFKKRKTLEALNVLEKQLQKANEEVTLTQNALREFKTKHPNIVLAAELQNSINSMAMMETSIYSTKNAAEEAQRLQNQLSSVSEADQNLVINEALLFLSRQGVVGAAVIQAEFNQLLQQQKTLEAGYSKTHPLVIENRSKLASVKAKTNDLLSQYITNSSLTSAELSKRIQQITARLQGLPLQQLQLAELERKAQVAAEIHSAVLARYNQAKISDAVEVPDVFVMDYAIEPEPIADFKNLIRLFSIGLLLVLGISFGPPIIVDFFDKTVRTEIEVKKLLPYTFLESIPKIEVSNRKREKSKKGESPKTTLRLIDPRLITASYTPDLTNEQFRALRSKILLRMHEIEKKKIIVTSYSMNEGKSLISANLAITMAQQKLKTILLDCDIRRGVLHNTFVLQKKPGLSELLSTEETISAEKILHLIQSTHVPNLSVITSGSNVPNPSELLGHPNFETFIEILSSMFDVIIADTPPLGLSVDAAIISNIFSAVILIVRSGKTNVINLKKRIDEFPSLKKKILGVVLNEALLDISVKKYKYYSYLY